MGENLETPKTLTPIGFLSGFCMWLFLGLRVLLYGVFSNDFGVLMGKIIQNFKGLFNP